MSAMPMTPGYDRPASTNRYRERTYRDCTGARLRCETVRVQETDLAVYTDNPPVADRVKQMVIEQRGYLEAYISQYPGFASSLIPWREDPVAPPIVREMIQASARAGVGPMAAVAGAIAQQVGQRLLAHADEVVIENGGDLFIHIRGRATIGVFAGDSPLSMKLGLQFDGSAMPRGVCTSSGRIGHSKSFGKADAVCVVCASSAMADAAATAIANRVISAKEIEDAIAWGRMIADVEGILIIVGDKIGVWGQMTMVPL